MEYEIGYLNRHIGCIETSVIKGGTLEECILNRHIGCIETSLHKCQAQLNKLEPTHRMY